MASCPCIPLLPKWTGKWPWHSIFTEAILGACLSVSGLWRVGGQKGQQGSKVKSSRIMRLFRPAPCQPGEQSALSDWLSQLRGWNNWSQRAWSKLLWQGCCCCKSSRVPATRSSAANQADRKSCSLSLWFLPRLQLSLTIPVPQQLLWLNLPPFYISFRVRFTH